MSGLIVLSGGRWVALVDEADRGWLSARSWYEANGYAQTKEPGTNRNLYMHRLVVGAGSGEIVHHRNENKLDNRRSNLQVLASNAEHMRQHRLAEGRRKRSRMGVGLVKRNRSGYRGVSYDSQAGKWRAQIHPSGGRKKHLGYFATPEEAARCYDTAARIAWPEGCFTNFPE